MAEKKTLKDYMMGLRKDHEYTIRIARYVVTDADMTRIENNLKAHELVDISKLKKTIHQSTAYGFPDPVNSEVFIFNVTLGLPQSCFYLGREIAKILKISEIYVAVTDSNYIEPVLDIKPTGKTIETFAKPEVEGEEISGEKYNMGMLKTILAARDADPLSIISTPSKKK